MTTTFAVRHLDNWTVVRLPDGRIGRYHRKGPGNKPVVILAGEAAVTVALADEVTVEAWPAMIARQYVEALAAEQAAADAAAEHPDHTECADGCGLDVNHNGACLDKPGGRQVCEHDDECDGCDGSGIILGMDTPEGIQRCDSCGTYPGDLEAAAFLAAPLGGRIKFVGSDGQERTWDGRPLPTGLTLASETNPWVVLPDGSLLTAVVCGTCEDYADDPRLVPTDDDFRSGDWLHVVNDSERCPGQGDDDTEDEASPRHLDADETRGLLARLAEAAAR